MKNCSNCGGTSFSVKRETSLTVALDVEDAVFEADLLGPVDVERCGTCHRVRVNEQICRSIGEILARPPAADSNDESWPRIAFGWAGAVEGSTPMPDVTVQVAVVAASAESEAKGEGSVTVRGPDVEASVPTRLVPRRDEKPTPPDVRVECHDDPGGAEVGIRNHENRPVAVQVQILEMLPSGWNRIESNSWRRFGRYRREKCTAATRYVRIVGTM